MTKPTTRKLRKEPKLPAGKMPNRRRTTYRLLKSLFNSADKWCQENHNGLGMHDDIGLAYCLYQMLSEDPQTRFVDVRMQGAQRTVVIPPTPTEQGWPTVYHLWQFVSQQQ
jgi:hypothetical protein